MSLYVGVEYQALDKQLVYERVVSGEADFLIISACYGLTHALEKIREYELPMDRSVQELWLRLGLPRVIEEYIANTGPEEVYGFFSKAGLYREIFRSVDVDAVKGCGPSKVLMVTCEGRGLQAMRVMGKAINHLLLRGELPKHVDGVKVAVHSL